MLAHPVPVGLSIAFACSSVLIPAIADTVLLLKVITVYPPSQMETRCIAALYGPITIVKIARMVVETIFIVRGSRAIASSSGHKNLFEIGETAWHTPYVRVAWFLQLVDAR